MEGAFADLDRDLVELAKSFGKCYNKQPGGQLVLRTDYTVSSQTKEKLRAAWTIERKKKASITSSVPRSNETKEKVRLAKLEYHQYLADNTLEKLTLS